MLKELLESGAIYDIELYPNCFLATFWSFKKQDYFTFIIHEDIDDRKLLLRTVKGKVLAGYNNWNYDDAVLNHLYNNPTIDLKSLWKYGNSLINGDRNKYRFNSFFKSYDLLEVIREGYSTKSLKGVGINLKFPKIQDLPFHYKHNINKVQLEQLIEYNKNDINITLAIFDKIKDRLEMRQLLSEQYKVDVYSVADSAIAKRLLDVLYTKRANDKDSSFNFQQLKKLKTIRDDIKLNDIIYPYISYKTVVLQDYLEQLKRLVIVKTKDTPTKTKYTCEIPTIIFGDINYTIALGGIHSEDEELIVDITNVDITNNEDNPLIVDNKENMLLDLDVASQYPTAILYNKLSPAHLDKQIFLDLLQDIVNKRLYYKKRKKEYKLYAALEGGLKITVNTIYGLLNSKTYWLFDPLVTFTVTVNNQLVILMLIEKLVLAGYKVISANTDGILLYINRNDLDIIRELYKQWEVESGFTLEEAEYDYYVRANVNNYLARKIDGEVKCKGLFVPQAGILKGYKFPIIAIALQHYFLDKIPIEQTIRTHNDIYDFCATQKLGNQFTNELELINRNVYTISPKTKKPYKKIKFEDFVIDKIYVQKTVRYYVSNPELISDLKKDEGCLVYKGYSLKKVKQLENGEYSKIDYVAGYFVTLFNDYYEVNNFEEYNINYSYYIDKCQKEIDKIENNK